MNVKMFYGRVSSASQNASRQIEDAERMGVDERYIFIDTASGRNFEREKYRAMVNMLRPGDEVYLTSLDRLGRSYSEVAAAWEKITQEIGAHIIVLDMPILDTRQHNDLTGRLICDIVLKLLHMLPKKNWRRSMQDRRRGLPLQKRLGNTREGSP